MRREPHIKLSQALKADPPEGFDLYEGVPYYTNWSMSLLACAHLAYYRTPGLFRNDARVAGDDNTRAERITRDLINAWPELAMRVKAIPFLSQILRRKHKQIFDSRNWSLFRAVGKVGPAIAPTLAEVGL